MLCGFRQVSRFVKTTHIHLKQATYLHCTVKISHFAKYPVRLISISDPFKDIQNETIYQCVNWHDLSRKPIDFNINFLGKNGGCLEMLHFALFVLVFHVMVFDEYIIQDN